MFKSSKFGGLSLEDLQEEQLPGEDEGEENSNVEVMEIFQPEQIEGDSTSDAEVVEDAIAEVEEVGEGLEALKEALSVSLADGGMNAQSAMFASLAYGNLTGKWVARDDRMPGMESFESAGGRLQATTYAIESIGETLKAWWQKLVTMMNKWIDAILSFYAKHLSMAGIYTKKAKALAKKAREHGGNGTGTVELAGAEVQNLTTKPGETISDTRLITELAATMASLKKSEDTDALIKQIKEFSAELDKVKFDKEKMDDLQSIFKTKISDIESAAKTQFGSLTEDHADYKSSDFVKYLVSAPMLGNRIIVVKIVGDKDGSLDSFKVSLEPYSKKTKFESVNAPALGSGDISKLAEEVASITGAVASYKADANKRRQVYNEVKNAYDKAVKGLDKSDWAKDNKEEHRYVKAKLTGFSSMAMSIVTPVTEAQKQVMASSRAAYNYALKSYKALDAKK